MVLYRGLFGVALAWVPTMKMQDRRYRGFGHWSIGLSCLEETTSSQSVLPHLTIAALPVEVPDSNVLVTVLMLWLGKGPVIRPDLKQLQGPKERSLVSTHTFNIAVLHLHKRSQKKRDPKLSVLKTKTISIPHIDLI